MTRKQKTFNHYLQVIQDKITGLQQVLADLKESAANETKSTAGDKYETALAMLQIEQANTSAQLKEMQQQLARLQSIDPALVTAGVVPGSLVKTNRGYLFISIAAGKTIIDGQPVIAISPQSPLGQALLNAGNTGPVTINTVTYTIESIE